MRVEANGKRVRVEFDSIHDMLDTVENNPIVRDCEYFPGHFPCNNGWQGEGVRTLDDAKRLAHEGLPIDGVKALEVASEKVSEIHREYEVPSFSSYYDVTGSDVDVARYLSGEPENMIAYTMVDTPSVGRVVSLVVSSIFSASIDADRIRQRGESLMGLVLILEQIGFQTEIYADWTTGRGGHEGRVTVPLKKAGESLDAGLVMYALTHASFSRSFIMPCTHLYPKKYYKPHNVGFGYGPINSSPELHSYPEGSLYFPAPIGYGDNYDTLIEDTLKDLGLIS